MTPAALKILRRLSEQKRQRDMAELTLATAKAAATAAQLEALAEEVGTNIEDTPPEDLAIISRWLGWAEQENSRLRSRHSIQEAQADSARSFAAISDAKTRVIKKLQKKAEHAELMKERRKAEQSGRAPDR